MPSSVEISNTLTSALSLAQPPVAVAFADSVPEGVPMWDSVVPAGCRFWQEAATRVFATTPRDHDLCAIGVYTHNLESTPASDKDLGDALKVFADLQYVRPEDIAAIPVLNSRPAYTLYGPLDRMPAPPDVVLLFVKPSQTLILAEAAQQAQGDVPAAMGRPACAVVPQAVNSGRAALSLGCCGARAYLDNLTDDVALFAIPAAQLEAVTARVSALANANGILFQFHTLRRSAVEGGAKPTVMESLSALQNAAGQ